MQELKLNLALQGGGAHGAFTWGVLDRLLETKLLCFDSISGTSAGAMNAIALTQGWLEGGAEGAKESLSQFWYGIATPDLLTQPKHVEWWRNLSQHLSPYDLNPFDINPLKDLLESQIDFERIRSQKELKLYIAATHVQTGGARIFREHELQVECLLASACLPTLHKAVEINGEYFWDGGFSANPVIRSLIRDTSTADMLIVLLQPLKRNHVPVTAKAIHERMHEIMFQSSFVGEISDAVEHIEHLKQVPWLLGKEEKRWRQARFHLIEPDELLVSMESISKFDTRKSFLESLRDRGRVQADIWLSQNQNKIGIASSWTL